MTRRRGGDETGRRVSRRGLLAAGAAAGVGLAMAGLGGAPSPLTVARAAAADPAGSDLGAVEHVIFLMMENRSFDHYYGTYPGVRGFDDHPARRPRPLLRRRGPEHHATSPPVGGSCRSTSTPWTPTSRTARSI